MCQHQHWKIGGKAALDQFTLHLEPSFLFWTFDLTVIFLYLKINQLGHSGWVTAIATTAEAPDMILTSSRGMYLV